MHWKITFMILANKIFFYNYKYQRFVIQIAYIFKL